MNYQYRIYSCIQFFAIVLNIHASSLPPISPKIWLSEYGHFTETEEIFTQLSFSLNQTENTFNNSFLSKTETEVVVHGNVSFIIFTCEAEYPVSWFTYQEVKINSEALDTRTLDFLSTSYESEVKRPHFRSLIYIYLDPSDHYIDTEEYFQHFYSGNWKFYCENIKSSEKNSRGASITLRFGQKLVTETFNPASLNIEERIIIAVLTNQHNVVVNTSGYSLNDGRRHYPSFDNQPIILERNLTVNLMEYYDTNVEYTKLVEHDLNENLIQGDQVQIFCFSSKKLYSYGAFMEILWENGTTVRLPEQKYSFNATTKIYLSDNSKYLGKQLFSNDEHSSEEDMLYFISKEILVERGMVQVNCNMPVWIDGKWDKVSGEIKVVPK